MCLDHVSRRRFLQFSAASAAMLAGGGVASAGSEGTALQSLGGAPRSDLTDGMIDFHVHTYPDNFPRTVSGVEAAQTAKERGLRAVVLKGGAFETMTRAAQARALIREAKASGVQKIVCTHADYDPINMSVQEQQEAAGLGAFIEHAYIGVFLGPDSPSERFRTWRGATVEQMAAAIKAVGAG